MASAGGLERGGTRAGGDVPFMDGDPHHRDRGVGPDERAVAETGTGASATDGAERWRSGSRAAEVPGLRDGVARIRRLLSEVRSAAVTRENACHVVHREMHRASE